jgi:o-succinylbenzoate synthase
MKWGIWSYKLPLQYPLAALGENKLFRRGFVIGVKKEECWLYGEASPIPSFHKVTHTSVFEELKQYFIQHTLPNSSVAQFAIDMLSLQATKEQSILINSLSSGDIVQDKNIPLNTACIKIKVGRRSLKDDLDHLRNIRDHFPKDTTIRVDANRLWDLDQAQCFIDNAQGFNIEYLEEPTKNIGDIQYLQGMNIALDESLEEKSEAILYPQVTHIIIKPTLQGGKKGIDKWYSLAKQTNRTLIFSSTFESSLGIWHIGHLAASITKNCCHGLGTLRWFQTDLTNSPLLQHNNYLFLPKFPPIINFNHTKLEASG